MIFQQWQQVLDGTKTQTRRLVDPNGYHDRARVCDHWVSIFEQEDTWPVLRVISAKGCTLWQVGKTYAVQPEHGQRAVWWRDVGHIQTIYDEECPASVRNKSTRGLRHDGWQQMRILLLAIRQEHVQDISPDDVYCEGLRVSRDAVDTDIDRLEQFQNLWDSIHTVPGTRWADNPLVWVLEFELVKEQETT